MIFDRETPSSYSKKISARVAKWENSFSERRERLRKQWEAECNWYPWFAWYAVDVGTYEKPHTAWLQLVERRLKHRNKMPTISAEWYLREFEYRIAAPSTPPMEPVQWETDTK